MISNLEDVVFYDDYAVKGELKCSCGKVFKDAFVEMWKQSDEYSRVPSRWIHGCLFCGNTYFVYVDEVIKAEYPPTPYLLEFTGGKIPPTNIKYTKIPCVAQYNLDCFSRAEIKKPRKIIGNCITWIGFLWRKLGGVIKRARKTFNK